MGEYFQEFYSKWNTLGVWIGGWKNKLVMSHSPVWTFFTGLTNNPFIERKYSRSKKHSMVLIECIKQIPLVLWLNTNWLTTNTALLSTSIYKKSFGPVLLYFSWRLQQGDFQLSAPENAALVVHTKQRHVIEDPTFHAPQSPLNSVCWHVLGEEEGHASSRAERGKAPTAMNKRGRWELEREAGREAKDKKTDWRRREKRRERERGGLMSHGRRF